MHHSTFADEPVALLCHVLCCVVPQRTSYALLRCDVLCGAPSLQAQGRMHHNTSALSGQPVALLCPHHLANGASPGVF